MVDIGETEVEISHVKLGVVSSDQHHEGPVQIGLVTGDCPQYAALVVHKPLDSFACETCQRRQSDDGSARCRSRWWRDAIFLVKGGCNDWSKNVS
jgi:hypothetical protein